MDVADWITLVRTGLVYLIAAAVALHWPYWWIWATLLLLIFVADYLDGFFARRLRCATVLGSLLDVAGDRITEITFWITYTAMGFVPAWAPILILSRAVLTDNFRAMAAERGKSVYGMIHSRLGKMFVSSRISRGLYGASKALFFLLLLLHAYRVVTLSATFVFWYSTYLVIYSLLRGFPVLLDARDLLAKD